MAPAIGLQLYTLKDVLAVAGSRPGVLERVAALGVESIEPYGFGVPSDARALRAEADAAGLAISSVHGAIPPPADAGPFFAALAEAGAPIAILPVPEALGGFDRDVFTSADGVARFADALSRLADVAEAEAGARVGYHNHGWEWADLPGGGAAYDALWERTDPRVLAEVDLYWAQAAGQSPAEVVARLGARVELVHVKDGADTTAVAHQVPLGTGTIALDEALAAGADTITTRVIEADAVDGDPMDYIAAGVAWLRDRRRDANSM
jgi:sugar phosphate isomerase/epimerase